MSKVTINEDVTPSKQLIAAAATEVSIKDATGRVINLKKPGILSQFKLVEMIGESAKNQVYLSMILPLTYVVSIDGDDVLPAISSKSALDALITRLDEHGVRAIQEAMQEHFDAASPEEAQEAIKK